MCSWPTASNEPIIASSGRWSNQLIFFLLLPAARRPSLRRATRLRQSRISDVVRIEPGVGDPALLVVVGHAGIGERDHAVVGAGAPGVEQRLNADVFVITRVVDLIELMPSAELGADRIPQQLHDLDALAVIDVVRA